MKFCVHVILISHRARISNSVKWRCWKSTVKAQIFGQPALGRRHPPGHVVRYITFKIMPWGKSSTFWNFLLPCSNPLLIFPGFCRMNSYIFKAGHWLYSARCFPRGKWRKIMQRALHLGRLRLNLLVLTISLFPWQRPRILIVHFSCAPEKETKGIESNGISVLTINTYYLIGLWLFSYLDCRHIIWHLWFSLTRSQKKKKSISGVGRR